MKEKFDEFVQGLREAKIPAKVKLIDSQFVIELGFDYPDELFDKIADVAEKLNIGYDQFDVCAECDGGTIERSCSINGGPKRY